MPKSLPKKPSLRFLQMEAKHLLKDLRAGKSKALNRIEKLRPTTQQHKFSLQQVQHALATEYGFQNWAALVSRVRLGNPSLQNVVRGMRGIVREYYKAGRPKSQKDMVFAALNRYDEVFRENMDYLRAKALQTSAISVYEADKVYCKIPDRELVTAGEIFNRLQDKKEKDAANCNQLVRRLLAVKKRALLTWIHDCFVQNFCKGIRQNTYEIKGPLELLDKLARPSSSPIAVITSGLRVWGKALEAEKKPAKLARIATLPIGGKGSLAPRYRLLVATILMEHPEVEGQAQRLIDQTIGELRKSTHQRANTEEWRYPEASRKQYLLAHAYYLKAKPFVDLGDTSKALPWLKKAAQAQPIHGRTRPWWLEPLLLGGKRNYAKIYAEQMTQLGRKEEALKAWGRAAIVGIEEVTALKAAYDDIKGQGQFRRYWEQVIAKALDPGPDFQLISPRKERFALSSLRGKWVVMHFWQSSSSGGPNKNLVDFQKIYDTVNADTKKQVVALAVSCDTDQESAGNLMKNEGCTFLNHRPTGELPRFYKHTTHSTAALIAPCGGVFAFGGYNYSAYVKRALFWLRWG